MKQSFLIFKCFLREQMVLARPKDNKALKSSQLDISLLSKNIGRKEKQIDCEAIISNNLFFKEKKQCSSYSCSEWNEISLRNSLICTVRISHCHASAGIMIVHITHVYITQMMTTFESNKVILHHILDVTKPGFMLNMANWSITIQSKGCSKIKRNPWPAREGGRGWGGY